MSVDRHQPLAPDHPASRLHYSLRLINPKKLLAMFYHRKAYIACMTPDGTGAILPHVDMGL